ncbi:MAG: Trk system potassium transporter TrkA [Clostridia bacterium]|nr:Trk system potassium transporter TrkA [Clostridia bacterium]
MSLFKKITTSDKQTLNVIIVGCGNIGTTLAERLSAEGHYITMIDKDAQAIQEVSDAYDVMGIVGNGSSYHMLLEAGIEKADLIIAVTDSDELNLLCCTVAKKVGHCAAIARVRTPDYVDELPYLRSRLDISMIINPELETAREIARLLRLPSAISINSFAKGHVEMVKFKLAENSILCDKSLMQMHDVLRGVLICGIERGEELTIPGGSFVFKAGDIISFIAPVKDTRLFFKRISVETQAVSSVMMVGGGRIAYYLAKMLIDEGIDVKIIEQDKERCSYLAENLSKAMIFCGNGSNENLLLESGIRDTDSFLPLTNIDEENILLSMYAKKTTNAKIITKVERTDFRNVISELNMDSFIYPRYLITESIIAYARAKHNSLGSSNIETLYQVFDGRAEAIELRVNEEEVTNTPLMNMHLKKDMLIACINRDGHIFIPSGTDCLMMDDTVIIVTKHSGFDEINDILA